jgi:hypothetical protein
MAALPVSVGCPLFYARKKSINPLIPEFLENGRLAKILLMGETHTPCLCDQK